MKYLFTLIALVFAAPTYAQDKECTDFSGLWRGRCDHSDGSSDSVRWQIAQEGCEKLLINGVKFEFGKQTASTRNNGQWSINSYERLDWDKNNENLDYDIRVVGRDVSGRNSVRGSGFGSMELLSDYLYFESIIDYTTRGPNTNRAWTEQNRCNLKIYN